MSIIVMGMEMPRVLGLNVTIYPDGRVVEYLGSSGKRIVGTAVPLPEKHGRLIDADELEHTIGQLSTSWEYGQGVSDCWDALIDSQTIVEAEGD